MRAIKQTYLQLIFKYPLGPELQAWLVGQRLAPADLCIMHSTDWVYIGGEIPDLQAAGINLSWMDPAITKTIFNFKGTDKGLFNANISAV